MQFKKAFIVAYLLAGSALAQPAEDALRSKIITVRYVPLAEQARIQGDVHLNLTSGVVAILSGHPLLAPVAVGSAKALDPVLGQTNVDLMYHFVLVDAISVPSSVTVKRGNVLKRAVLRMFGLKTEKTVLTYRCEEGIPPANDVRVDGAVIEIWIYGRTRCLQTQTTLVARG